MWVWSEPQQKAFQQIKRQLSSTPVLALYHPDRLTTVSADSSSFGLGAVITQKQPDATWRPVAYCSRSLSNTEQKYAQIEKEALALTFGCERFSDYLIGKQFHVETDHKPLVSLLGSKNLDELPIRIQRYRMRLMRFSYTISYVPGKQLVIADALSRAPLSSSTPSDDDFQAEVEMFVNAVIQSVPATEQRLKEIQEAQEADEIFQKLHQYCKNGWSHRQSVAGAVQPYLSAASEITVNNGLLLKGNRIIVPSVLRLDILDKLHSGHQGISKCRERARQAVWWPGLNRQLEELVRSCSKCCRDRFQHAEPLMNTELPSLPWKKVTTDLFYWKSSTYLLIVDYYSRYIEISKLNGQSSLQVITHTKSIFARHGIPQEVVSDNGPPYSSFEYKQFAAQYGFTHTTSSPRYPQSNGEAERAVKTVKSLLKKSDDPYMALMIYRSTPLNNGFSPSELLVNKRLRTTLPVVESQLQPAIPEYNVFREKETMMKANMKRNFDVRHRAHALDPLPPGQQVWISGRRDS